MTPVGKEEEDEDKDTTRIEFMIKRTPI